MRSDLWTLLDWRVRAVLLTQLHCSYAIRVAALSCPLPRFDRVAFGVKSVTVFLGVDAALSLFSVALYNPRRAFVCDPKPPLLSGKHEELVSFTLFLAADPRIVLN